MKLIKRNYVVAIIISIVLTIVIFWQFFFKGLHPFPGNYLLAWYQPWKTDHTKEQTITIQHKPVADDTFRYLYPFKKLGIDMARKGELPLWNPYNGAGMPLLATYQSGFFNPFNILFLAMQSETAWSLYIIAQVFLLSFFMYLYCRKIHLGIRSATFSTIIFVLSGFVTARLIFGNLIYPLAMLPLILYLVEDYIGNQKSRKIFLLPLVIAFLLLSGHPHTIVYTTIVSICYFIYRIWRTKKFLLLATLFFVGVGIACIQIIPTIELLKSSNMSLASSAFIFDRFLLPPSHLISMLIPNYFGNQATYNYWGAGDYIETVAAVGIIPLFFAYLALFGKNSFAKDNRLFFFLVCITSILATLNWFLPKLLYQLPIPIVSTSPPSRVLAIATFSIAILAGYGFDRWVSYAINFRRLLLQVMPFVIIVFVVSAGTFLFYKLNIPCDNKFIQNCRLIAVRNTLLETSGFALSLGFIFLYMKTGSQKIKQCISFIIIFLILSLGAYNSYKFSPFSKSETILPVHPLIENIKGKTTQGRIFGFGEANIKTNFATFFRFYDPNYFDPLHNRRYSELVAFANTGTTAGALSRSDIEITTDPNLTLEKQARRNRILNLLGVSYLIFKKSETEIEDSDSILWQNEEWLLLKNKNSLPRTYLVSSNRVIKDDKQILEILFDTSFDPLTTVITEEPILNPPDTITTTKGEVKILHYKENAVEINVQSEGNKLLVLSDNYYPGWKAFIDNKETKVYRANYTFRAIVVPAGKHRITFRYEPASLKIGMAISILSVGIFILLAKRSFLFLKN